MPCDIIPFVKLYPEDVVKRLIILIAFAVMLIATSWDRRIRDYIRIQVDEEDIIDAKAMLDPPKKYCQLLKINDETRKLVSEYMQMNNYKLKPGNQVFIKNNPTFKELISDGFKFVKIEE